jgi:hypothetical protein
LNPDLKISRSCFLQEAFLDYQPWVRFLPWAPTVLNLQHCRVAAACFYSSHLHWMSYPSRAEQFSDSYLSPRCLARGPNRVRMLYFFPLSLFTIPGHLLPQRTVAVGKEVIGLSHQLLHPRNDPRTIEIVFWSLEEKQGDPGLAGRQQPVVSGCRKHHMDPVSRQACVQ